MPNRILDSARRKKRSEIPDLTYSITKPYNGVQKFNTFKVKTHSIQFEEKTIFYNNLFFFRF